MPSISRRKVLGGLALGGVGGYAFRDPIDRAIFARLRDCPDPDQGTALETKIRQHGGGLIDRRVAVVTSPEERTGLQTDGLSDADRTFLERVDFDDSFLLVIEMLVHAGAKGVKFTGIERDGPGAVSSYSCTVHPYPLWYIRPEKEVHTLAGRTHGWLVQVQADFDPETVRHTHKGTLRTAVMGSD